MDYFPGGAQKDSGDGQPRLPQIPLGGFSGTTKQGWKSGFSGYAGLMPKELFNLSRRLQLHGSSGFKIKVTATVIGYRETGVMPVPVIVLDPDTKRCFLFRGYGRGPTSKRRIPIAVFQSQRIHRS